MKKTKNNRSRNRDDSKNSPFEDRKRFCPFSNKNSPNIDYKDTKLLSKYIVKKVKLFQVELPMCLEVSKKNYL